MMIKVQIRDYGSVVMNNAGRNREKWMDVYLGGKIVRTWL